MITLYTIRCPACNVLETKLQAKNIQYETVESEDAIRELGFDSAPLLKVDDQVMDFRTAINYINNLEV